MANAEKVKTETLVPEVVLEVRDLDQCHVDGVLVKDLPKARKAGIFFALTDEGLEERMAKLLAEGRLNTGPKVEITRSEFTGKVKQFGEFRAGHPEDQVEAPDPMRELVDKHVGPGLAPKFLSKAVINRKGKRGYEPVMDEDGHPVELGGMVLATIPKEVAEARTKAYQSRSDVQLGQVLKEHGEEQEKLISDAGLRPSEVQPDLDQGLLRESG